MTVGGRALLGLILLAATMCAAGSVSPGLEADVALWGSTLAWATSASLVSRRAILWPRRRQAWWLLGGALWAQSGACLLRSVSSPLAPVSLAGRVCDGFELCFYLLAAVSLVKLARSDQVRRPPLAIWLDGSIAFLGPATVGALLLLRPVQVGLRDHLETTILGFAHPIGDLLLVAVAVGVVAQRGSGVTRPWRLLLGAGSALTVADCLDLLGTARSQPAAHSWAVALHILAACLVALAASQRCGETLGAAWTGRSSLATPGVIGLAVVVLVPGDHWLHLDPVTFALAELTVLATLARWATAVRESRAIVASPQATDIDDVTGLANRRALMGRIEAALGTSAGPREAISLVLVDIDNFKDLNETLGPAAGDELLRLVAERLLTITGDRDAVARLGDDEFAVMLDTAALATATIAARRLLGEIQRPYDLGGISLQMTASLGIAAFPEHAADAQQLLARADTAMHQAKRSRRGLEIYEHRDHARSLERLGLGAELGRAIRDHKLEVHFQPKARAVDRSIVGVEALVRWRRADGADVPPPTFLRIAEQAGLSRELTDLVLDTALGQLAVWRAGGSDLHVSVNTTVADLVDLDFPARVRAALHRSGVPADALVLEITESAILRDPDRIKLVIDELRDTGVSLSLDDFGTGYSSLSHLVSFPVDELKLDRSFVSEMSHDPTRTAIVVAMLDVARQLDLRVIAEGVEDEATADLLARLGCDHIQGYLVSRPVPAEQLTQLLGSVGPTLVQARRSR